MPSFKKYEISFFTATILEWKFLLSNNNYKDIIMCSLQYLVVKKRIYLYGFVIMNNHLHLLWHIIYPNTKDAVQRDFLKFTAQMIIYDLKANHLDILNEYFVDAKDRKHQIWERNPLTIEIWNEDILKQKLNYIHNNPVPAGLCTYAEEYKYSSASFYREGMDSLNILTSCFM